MNNINSVTSQDCTKHDADQSLLVWLFNNVEIMEDENSHSIHISPNLVFSSLSENNINFFDYFNDKNNNENRGTIKDYLLQNCTRSIKYASEGFIIEFQHKDVSLNKKASYILKSKNQLNIYNTITSNCQSIENLNENFLHVMRLLYESDERNKARILFTEDKLNNLLDDKQFSLNKIEHMIKKQEELENKVESLIKKNEELTLEVYNFKNSKIKESKDPIFSNQEILNGNITLSLSDRLKNHLKSIYTLKSHTDYVWALCYLGNNTFASAGADKSIIIWKSTGELIKNFKNTHNDYIWKLTYLGKGLLASGSYDKTIKIWKISNGELVKTLASNAAITALCLLENDILVSGGFDKMLQIWKISVGIIIKKLELHTDYISTICNIGDDHFASSGRDLSIIIWKKSTYEVVRIIKNAHKDNINTLSYIHNGLLASGSFDSSIKIWKVFTGELVSTFIGHKDKVWDLCYLGNDFMASSSQDKTINIWKISNQQLIKTLKEHDETVFSLCLLENDIFASGSKDSTIKIWGFTN